MIFLIFLNKLYIKTYMESNIENNIEEIENEQTCIIN
jgi:hypothetical protein